MGSFPANILLQLVRYLATIRIMSAPIGVISKKVF